jgi:ribosome-associated protein
MAFEILDSGGQLNLDEVHFSAIRAQGAGGQNVNKVSSAIHLTFDIKRSSLADSIKSKLLAQSDTRLTNDGLFVLKAQTFRTQERNKQDAIQRLVEWINQATKVQKTRRKTKPSRASKLRRMEKKSQKSQVKNTRKKVDY